MNHTQDLPGVASGATPDASDGRADDAGGVISIRRRDLLRVHPGRLALAFTGQRWLGAVTPFGSLYGLWTLLEDSIRPEDLILFEAQQIDDAELLAGVPSGFEFLGRNSKCTQEPDHADEDEEFPHEEHQKRNAKDQYDSVCERRDVSSHLVELFREEKAARDVGSGPKRRPDGVKEEEDRCRSAEHPGQRRSDAVEPREEFGDD